MVNDLVSGIGFLYETKCLLNSCKEIQSSVTTVGAVIGKTVLVGTKASVDFNVPAERSTACLVTSTMSARDEAIVESLRCSSDGKY